MSFKIYDVALLTVSNNALIRLKHFVFLRHLCYCLLYIKISIISIIYISTCLDIYIPCGGALDVAALVAAVPATLPQLHQVGLLCNIC